MVSSAERNTAEQPIETEDAAAFGGEMGQRADDAAQAAVTFADAVADEVTAPNPKS